MFFYLTCVINILIKDSTTLELITKIIVKIKNSGKYLTKKLFTYWLTSYLLFRENNSLLAGIEPATYSLENCYSIQLSYRSDKKTSPKSDSN